MSNFLENLKKSLDSGTADESVKKQFDQIVEKAENFKDKYDTIEKIDAVVSEATSQRKPLTEEERKEMEFLAMKQQQKIDEFEYKGMLSATLVNIDLAIEKLNNKIMEFCSSSEKLRDETLSIAEKKDLMKEVLKNINKIEAPIAPGQYFKLGNDDTLYAEKF